jgi:hypothetical protein
MNIDTEWLAVVDVRVTNGELRQRIQMVEIFGISWMWFQISE